MVEVRNIAFSYDDRPVLRDVSFVVSPGEVVSIVGGNGAGKTTLLRLLAMLAIPNSGKVIIDGQDVLSRPLKYRHLIGYLPESVALDGDMTVKDYLVYRALLKGEPSKRVRRRVSEAAEICRLTDCLHTTIDNLSTGTQKRVALADVLLLRPRVLLLDDFLAGFDRQMRRTMGEVLSNAAAFSSVIVTGHEIPDFVQWTTKFLVLHDGVMSAEIATAGIAPELLVQRVDAAQEGSAR